MINIREAKIIDFIKVKQECSSKEIHDSLSNSVSYATTKRILTKLTAENLLITKGQGKGTKYLISPAYGLLQQIDIEKYYEKEIDQRKINENFNFSIITDVLSKYNVFTDKELDQLLILQNAYKSNILQLSDYEYKK